MRKFILLFVNGREHRVSGTDAFLTLSDYLRLRLGLCGTKIVCSEGDCGSCSTLCGKLSNDLFSYQTIDSCIRFVFQLDGCHVVTVEGLSGSDKSLNSVQQAMIDCHGSQCGYCTPGFVVAMTGMLEHENAPSEDAWRHGLTGNLCRCTGYWPIIAAGLKASEIGCNRVGERFNERQMFEVIKLVEGDSIQIESSTGQTVACPTSLDEATAFLASHPDAKIVAGATDVGVQFNKGHCQAACWLDLNRVPELTGVSIDGDQIVAGSRATWAEFEELCKDLVPAFYEIVSVFGSPQIRNVGTIGGNIINASPIADSLPFLFICDASLVLVSKSGSREVNINNFYHGYKKFDLQPGELLTQIRIPLMPAERFLRLYKVSRRRDLDISTFTAAVWVDLDGDNILDAGIAYGAVGPVVLRLRKTEAFLRGKAFNETTMREAGDVAVGEITPITDVRGGVDYRLQLARNVLLKFFHELRQGVIG